MITASIIAMENYLGDNAKFNDFDDLLRFVDYTLQEELEDFSSLLDSNIPKQKLIKYLISKTTKIDDKDILVVEKMINRLSAGDINKLYYKNKLTELFTNSYFQLKMKSIVDGNLEKADDFRKLIVDITYSNILFEDRFRRANKDPRNTVVVVDTDSVFINASKHIKSLITSLGYELDDKDTHQNIFNKIIDISTEALERLFSKITGMSGIAGEFKKIINMKYEYNYARIMVTRNKKNYAGLMTAKLGKLVDPPKLDMKGLSIRKSSTPKRIRDQFTTILLDDILKSKTLNIRDILKKFDELGEAVKESLLGGSLEYAIPKSLDQYDSYKDASSIESVRGAIIWNALEPEDTLVPPDKCNFLKLKASSPDHPELLKLKETNPEKYNTIMKVVFNEGQTNPIDISRFGFTAIAIPKSVERIPEYLIPFIDIPAVVNSNISNGFILLESMGIYVDEFNKMRHKSNIIEI